jgi:hypothetical protein
MTDQKSALEARVFMLAALRGLPIKNFSISFATARATGGDSEISDEQILENLRRLQTAFPDQFAEPTKPGAPKESPVQMLERANKAAAQQRERTTAPTSPKVKMTPAQRAFYDGLTPDQRVDFAQKLSDSFVTIAQINDALPSDLAWTEDSLIAAGRQSKQPLAFVRRPGDRAALFLLRDVVAFLSRRYRRFPTVIANIKLRLSAEPRRRARS